MKVIVRRSSYWFLDITEKEHEGELILIGTGCLEGESMQRSFCEYKSNIFIIVEDFR